MSLHTDLHVSSIKSRTITLSSCPTVTCLCSTERWSSVRQLRLLHCTAALIHYDSVASGQERSNNSLRLCWMCRHTPLRHRKTTPALFLQSHTFFQTVLGAMLYFVLGFILLAVTSIFSIDPLSKEGRVGVHTRVRRTCHLRHRSILETYFLFAPAGKGSGFSCFSQTDRAHRGSKADIWAVSKSLTNLLPESGGILCLIRTALKQAGHFLLCGGCSWTFLIESLYFPVQHLQITLGCFKMPQSLWVF